MPTKLTKIPLLGLFSSRPFFFLFAREQCQTLGGTSPLCTGSTFMTQGLTKVAMAKKSLLLASFFFSAYMLWMKYIQTENCSYTQNNCIMTGLYLRRIEYRLYWKYIPFAVCPSYSNDDSDLLDK